MLVPFAKEVICSAIELPITLSKLKEHNQKLFMEFGVTFDYSYLEQFDDPENWWLEIMTNDQTKLRLTELIQKNIEAENPHFAAVSEYYKTYGNPEPDLDLFNRS